MFEIGKNHNCLTKNQNIRLLTIKTDLFNVKLISSAFIKIKKITRKSQEGL